MAGGPNISDSAFIFLALMMFVGIIASIGIVGYGIFWLFAHIAFV